MAHAIIADRSGQPQVERARVNLSTKRVSVVWRERVDGVETDPVSLVRYAKVLVTRNAVAKFEEMWG